MGTREDVDVAGSTLGKRKGKHSPQYNALFHSENGSRRGSYDNNMNCVSNWSNSQAARTQAQAKAKAQAQSHAQAQTQAVGTRTPPIITQMNNLFLRPASVEHSVEATLNSPAVSRIPMAKTPVKPLFPAPASAPSPASKLPVFKTPVKPPPPSPAPTSSRSTKKTTRDSPSKVPQFLTKYSQVQQPWDHDEKLQGMMELCSTFVERMQGTATDGDKLNEAIDLYKSRGMTTPFGKSTVLTRCTVVIDLEMKQTKLTDHNVDLRVELDTVKHRFSVAEFDLQDAKRNHETALSDLEQRQRIESESIRQEARRHFDNMLTQHQEELREMRRHCENEIEEQRKIRMLEINNLNSQISMDMQRGQIDLENKSRELQNTQRDLERVQAELEHERKVSKEMQDNMLTVNGNTVTLESSVRALKAHIEFLESGNKEQSDAFARLDKELAEALSDTALAKEKLRKEETLRRKLHNQVQELKGNIRVFCRVRPVLSHEPSDEVARIAYPDEEVDCKEIVVQGPEERSSLGTVTTKNHSYSFDHVFGPSSQNDDVFEEISQLVQSALDGYNVCIFCYGQTGSGKTHTMSSEDGMITRAVHQIYETARSLEEKGWTYVMEGNFVEVYNENLNDLLGDANQFDRKKHEIRHDIQRCKTIITDINTVTLDSPETVETILRHAAMNRSVAATKANERSSRSHSVFILKLIGQNRITGERSEGTLNLVDLAGSERLSHSGATGERLRETQNINRSLSCLGDVIGALGQGKEGGHIPYRNSKV